MPKEQLEGCLIITASNLNRKNKKIEDLVQSKFEGIIIYIKFLLNINFKEQDSPKFTEVVWTASNTVLVKMKLNLLGRHEHQCCVETQIAHMIPHRGSQYRSASLTHQVGLVYLFGFLMSGILLNRKCEKDSFSLGPVELVLLLRLKYPKRPIHHSR